MSLGRFKITSHNPNEDIGGGGCLCSEITTGDCKGPFAVFYSNEMANNLSPHAVLSLECAKQFVQKAEDGDEVLD